MLKKIYFEGNDFYDEGRPLIELINLRISIEKPDHKDNLIWSVCDKKTIKLFRDSFLGKEKWLEDVDITKNFEKTDAISYSVRLCDYEGFDQIKNVIKRLAKIPESKRCLISTPMPHKDWSLDYLPCIDTIHFLIRDSRLNAFIHCRGLDFAQKAYANFVCLAELQKYVLDEINKLSKIKYKIGGMEIMVDSAHIYSNTKNIAKNLITKINNFEAKNVK